MVLTTDKNLVYSLPLENAFHQSFLPNQKLYKSKQWRDKINLRMPISGRFIKAGIAPREISTQIRTRYLSGNTYLQNESAPVLPKIYLLLPVLFQQKK